jgi:nucleotide-binding universal stress UspA family protein
MSGVLIFIVLWVLCGITAGLVMGRHGYDPLSWTLIGALLGPLILVLALFRSERDAHAERVEHRGADANTGVRVLVGVDGSPAADAAVREVSDLLGPRVGSLTLATVIDYDAAAAVAAMDTDTVFERDARKLLERCAALVPELEPSTVLLEGRPARALAEYANAHDVDLVVVGARGRGFSERLLGSVAQQLVRTRGLLVLVADRAPDRHTALSVRERSRADDPSGE